MRKPLGLTLFLGLPALLAPALAETRPAGQVTTVAPFTLPDVAGKEVPLASFRDRKAVAVVFVGTECPVNNAYLPRLAELHKEYAPKGVQFLAINANVQDTRERIAAHAAKYPLPFPVLKDEGNRVADQFGARRTPEAFVLAPDGKVLYRGRIDDQFGVGFKRARPTQRELVAALDEVLTGKPVTRPVSEVAGCFIGRAAPTKDSGAVTYAQHVSRIFQQNCQSCHRAGQIGPMPLVSYQDAVAWSDTIREVLLEKRMPPWYADPKHGTFRNDRRLADADRATLLAWLDQGCPKGDPAHLPPPRSFPEGWAVGKPDVIFSMEEEFEVPADTPPGGVPYKHFYVKTNFTEDKWIQKAEARPGANEVVHHIVVFVVPPGAKFNPRLGNAPVLCGEAPGDMPLDLPDGMAKKVPAGSTLVLQMHYTPNGRAQKDRSSVGLVFSKEKPKYWVRTFPVANPALFIPPGADNHQVESWYTFREDASLVAFMPHMHLRGKAFKYEAVYPDGTTETLLNVPRYNFNWQSAYQLSAPKKMPKGTKLHCTAHFDNSDKNPNNPDATKLVRWGDQTWEEMMIGWIDFYYDDQKP